MSAVCRLTILPRIQLNSLFSLSGLPQCAASNFLACPNHWHRWDPLTKEIFQYVRSKGVATFSQIDAHIKATAAKHIAGVVSLPGHCHLARIVVHGFVSPGHARAMPCAAPCGWHVCLA